MSERDELNPSAHKILVALGSEYEPQSELDLFIRLRPMDRMALYHTLRALVADGLVIARHEGRFPDPNYEVYSLPDAPVRGVPPISGMERP